jgi:hypothetical protein
MVFWLFSRLPRVRIVNTLGFFSVLAKKRAISARAKG